MLFDRNRRGTALTPAGAAFLQDIRRLFTVLEQARENVRAVAAGLRGNLRIAVSDGATDPRLSAFLARCRAEEPEVEIRLSEVPLAEQLRGLRSGDFTIGFAHTADVGDGIVAEPIWRDPLVLAVPARHELLAHREVPLHELGSHPLVLCDPQVCEGYCHQLAQLLRPLEHKPNVVEHASSLDMMLPCRCRLRRRLHNDDQDRWLPASGCCDPSLGDGVRSHHYLLALVRKQQYVGFAGAIHRSPTRPFGRLTAPSSDGQSQESAPEPRLRSVAAISSAALIRARRQFSVSEPA